MVALGQVILNKTERKAKVLKKISLLVIFVLFMPACSSESNEQVIQTAIALTQEALPTETPIPPTETSVPQTETPNPTETPYPTETPVPPTETPIPLSAIDLEPIILQSGDLPEQLLPDFVYRDFNERGIQSVDIPDPDNFIVQRFHNQERNNTGGGAYLYIYNDIELANRSYRRMLPHISSPLDMLVTHPEVGEQSQMVQYSPTYSLIFTRCNAFIHILMVGVREFDIVSYAQNLDARLQDTICKD
jgi:hypothetical protein